MDEEDEDINYFMPARWWYASTAIPLMAGTFGPIANAFSVCALAQNWRVEAPPGGTKEHDIDVKDPKWQIVVNAISLGCALISNLFLLLHMARRISFDIAQPVTILGFWIASVLLISLICVASANADSVGTRNQVFTQAYFYAVFAAGLYQMISYLMCLTVYGAYSGHYSREFNLTATQRTLMLQTISFLFYLLIWALAYSNIESWKFLDALYFVDFSCLTIGIGGDYVPATHLGRSLLFPFALGGITILGLVVGSIRSIALDRGKKKIDARMTEKTRRRLVTLIKKNKLKDGQSWRGHLGMTKEMCRALTLKPGDETMPEEDRQRYEFDAMRKVQELASNRRKSLGLVISALAFAFLWMTGAYIFFRAEKNQHWSYFESLYFSYTSLLTIGYGDFQPLSNAGTSFFVFWSLLAIPTLTILISNMSDTMVNAIRDATNFVGEISVLPSNDASISDRLKYGLQRSSLGLLDYELSPRQAVKSGISRPGGKTLKTLHTGLARSFGKRGIPKLEPKSQGSGQRLASEFEQSEKKDGEEAKDRGDGTGEDEHCYRQILLRQVRRVYLDSTAPSPKKYSYEEWAYFLKLLGEYGSDSRHQSQMPNGVKRKEEKLSGSSIAVNVDGHRGQMDVPPLKQSDGSNHNQVVRWSWIGSRTPLIGDKEETEWLLDKLLKQLEESLRGHQQSRGHCGAPSASSAR